VLILIHRKLLSSKATKVNVAETSGHELVGVILILLKLDLAPRFANTLFTNIIHIQ
jgi:hypothetical protein